MSMSDIVKRLDGYAEIPDMDRNCQRDIWEAAATITTLRSQVADLTAQRDAAKAEESKQTAKAECYGSKLFGVVSACKEAGITLEHKGLGQGWTEECGKIITTIASLTAQRDAMREALNVAKDYLDWNEDPDHNENFKPLMAQIKSALALCQPSPGAQPSKGSP